MSSVFKKVKENFTCGNCGVGVTGDGYTNHCPKCLWSKHVDINPGDRAASCLGAMQPIGIEEKSGEMRIRHKCVKCGAIRVVRTSSSDNLAILLYN